MQIGRFGSKPSLAKDATSPIPFAKKERKGKREGKRKKNEKNKTKNNKIKKKQNDHKAVYKWVKTDEFLRGLPHHSNFSEVCTPANATIIVNAPTCQKVTIF